MKILIIFILLVSQIDASEIKARAIYQIWHPTPKFPADSPKPDAQVSLEEFKIFSIWLYLTNVGTKPLRIPTTSSIEARFPEKSDSSYVVLRRWEDRENPLEIKGIVAESSLGVVALNPGETTIIEIVTHIEEHRYTEVRIAYEVEASFAERNKLWHGEISVVAEQFNLSKNMGGRDKEPTRQP